MEVIINSLKDEDDSLAPFGRLIQDMKLIAKTFKKIRFLHICHQENFVAHKITKYVLYFIGLSV